MAIIALVFVRIVAVTMTAPILGSKAVGLKMRMAIAVMLMMLVIPMVHVPDALRSETALTTNWVPYIFSEAAIGITLGLGVSIMFSAASAAGASIGQLAGLQLGDTGTDSRSPIQRFYHVVSVAAFALIGGPALVLTGLLDTFIHIPLATTLNQAPLLEMITQLLQQSFMLMLKAIGPVITALLGSNVVLGIISRTYPQMNLFGMGLGSNLVVMFLSVFLSLGGTTWLFMDDIAPTIEWIQSGLVDAQSVPTAQSAENSGPILPSRAAISQQTGPAFSQPVFQQPGFQQPTFQQPGFQQPAFAQPVPRSAQSVSPGWSPGWIR